MPKNLYIDVQRVAEAVFVAMVSSSRDDWSGLTWEGMAEEAFRAAYIFGEEAERRYQEARRKADSEHAERALEAHNAST